MTSRGYYISILCGAFVVSATLFFAFNGADMEQPIDPEREGGVVRLSKNGQEGVLDEGPVEAENEPEPEALLPDIRIEELSDAYIVTGPGGQKKLRFPATFINTGDGPLELVGALEEETGTTRATQNIIRKDGSTEERHVGNFVFHDDHKHWHFEDFVEFELFSLKEKGEPDQKLASTGKMTFCIQDYAPLSDDFPGKPAEAVYPQCVSDMQGISVGWADTYLAEIPGQEIDIAGISDGVYAFRSIVDPENRVLEKDETNNSSITYIEIMGNDVRILSDTSF